MLRKYPRFIRFDGKSMDEPMEGTQVLVPGFQVPSFRTTVAIDSGVERNLLITTWGGIGDQICAEPTLRHAVNAFPDCKVTLASEIPEIFSHIKFHDVFDLKKERPIYDDYLVFETIPTLDTLLWQFNSHMLMNAVDFPSLSAFRCMLPIKDKVVTLIPPFPKGPMANKLMEIADSRHKYVIIHAGRHWPSKTFPVDWWNAALDSIKKEGFVPVLIGKEGTDKMDNQGTVQTSTDGCVDLRNKTTLNETIWLLQNSAVMVCSDSSPLHMGVTGKAWIGCIATVKHPDFIFHWRHNLEGEPVWSWRTENLGVGGMWEVMDHCPNKENAVNVDNVEESLLRSWLPDPKTIGFWCSQKMDSYMTREK